MVCKMVQVSSMHLYWKIPSGMEKTPRLLGLSAAAQGWCIMESRKQIALPEQVKILRSRWHNQSSHYFYCLQSVRKNKCLRGLR